MLIELLRVTRLTSMLRVELDWPIAVYRHSVLSLLVFLLAVVGLLLAVCL